MHPRLVTPPLEVLIQVAGAVPGVAGPGTNPSLARPEFDRLKAILHDCRNHGPTVANRQHHNDFRAHLLGRISRVAALNPARGTRLRGAFDAISWEQ